MRLIKLIPNIITLGNLFCGMLAIIFAISSDFESAFIMIVAAAVFDFFDGFAARLLKAQSPIGAQLDSLCDVVSFGVAPAMVVFYMGAGYVAFMIALFAAYRLAKFNVDTRQSDSFIGLPVPANALLFATIGYVSQTQSSLMSLYFSSELVLKFLVVLFSFLMVSEVPMFAIKFKTYDFKSNAMVYIFILASLLSLIFFGVISIIFIVFGYIALSIISNFVKSRG